jgi:quercetin dioxygenase-like cupin family protein
MTLTIMSANRRKWPRTDFLELLGITHPIVQAPMSGLTPPTLVAAVCNAGALGSIGCALLPPTMVREQVMTLRQATNRPFNLNFFVHARPRTTPQATARVRAKLTPYFDEFGLGPETQVLPNPRRKQAMKTDTLRMTSALALLALSLGVPAHAETGKQLILDVDFAPRDVVHVEVGDFHFLPGQLAPLHTHAAPAIGYVSKGTIYYQVEGQPAQILKAGDAFYEPVGPKILQFDNASKSEEAVFTDFNLEQTGEPFIVFAAPPTEKIDRRTFPTAPIVAAGVSKAVAVSEHIGSKPLTRTEADPVVGYVAQGALTIAVNGGATQRYAQGQSFFAPAGSTARYAAAGQGATIVSFALKR